MGDNIQDPINIEPSKLVGKTVVKVVKETGSTRGTDAICLIMDDSTNILVVLDGDCCSGSYFEDKNQFDELIGSKITEVLEEEDRTEDNGAWERIIWSFLKFTTDKGHVTIDWRNESNGYYSGWVKFFKI
ncbi:MAG: hypothetical protein KGO96_07050 [Elusimicrobia bacterium]|nr:hypothetical protein [Elusimicrobiota bacterium]